MRKLWLFIIAAGILAGGCAALSATAAGPLVIPAEAGIQVTG